MTITDRNAGYVGRQLGAAVAKAASGDLIELVRYFGISFLAASKLRNPPSGFDPIADLKILCSIPLTEYYTDLPSTLHTSLFHFPDAEIRCAYLVIVPERLRVALRNQSPRFKHVTTISDRECHVGILFHQ
jgi:hypothetical protein